LLDDRGIEYRYRDYKKQPLSQDELRSLFKKLGRTPGELLRRNDRAYKETGLTGDESASRLIGLMAKHPTLLQRPIGVKGRRAVVGRPPENLLDLAR
jgi:arsenate reductase